jgi:FkbM family methyltransferase
MNIYYGVSPSHSIDVTSICLSTLTTNNTITIPEGDHHRAYLFTDPFPGSLKKIFVLYQNRITEYNDSTIVKIVMMDSTSNDEKMNRIHSNLTIQHGDLHDELPEQKMVVRYLTGTEKVLEIGGNIGRNSLVISSILHDSANLVTLESDPTIAQQLIENRELNHFRFHVEISALSNQRLIQQGWITIPSDTLPEGFHWVNTITLPDLKSKYNIDFDTLVLDCEGAFYYILMDMPEILTNIKLIIMENDYHEITHKQYIDTMLLQHNFYIDYQESGGWGPCYHNFFEVWKKM